MGVKDYFSESLEEVKNYWENFYYLREQRLSWVDVGRNVIIKGASGKWWNEMSNRIL